MIPYVESVIRVIIAAVLTLIDDNSIGDDYSQLTFVEHLLGIRY